MLSTISFLVIDFCQCAYFQMYVFISFKVINEILPVYLFIEIFILILYFFETGFYLPCCLTSDFVPMCCFEVLHIVGLYHY